MLITCLLIALLVIAAGYKLLPVTTWSQHSGSQTPIDVTAVQIGTINKPIRITRTGSIEKAVSIPVYTEFSGRIDEIYVTEGQSVKAGQPLFKLEVSSPAANNSETSPVVSDQNTGSSPEIQNNYDNALKEYNRYKKLFDIGAIPRRQMEEIAARLQEAQKSLNNSSQSVSPSENAATVPVSGSVTTNAPTDGIVTGLAAASGAAVQAGQQLMALGSGQELEMVVHLAQNELYLVHLGSPATIQAASQAITGQISSIYPEIQANQISSFLAHIKLTNTPAGLLQHGMPANVQIDSGKSVVVPAVSKGSVFQDEEGRSFIYEVVKGRAVCQQVSIGETIGDFIEITSNLPPEAMVITDKVDEIKNGDAIAVQ